MATETLCFDTNVKVGRRVEDPEDDNTLGPAGTLSFGSINSPSAISNSEGTTGVDAIWITGDRWIEMSGDNEIDIYGSETYDIAHNRTLTIGMSPADIMEVNVYATTNLTHWAPVTETFWMTLTQDMHMPHMQNEQASPDFTWKTTSMGWTKFSFSVTDLSVAIKTVFSSTFHMGFDLSLGNIGVSNKLMEGKFWTMKTDGKLAFANIQGAEGKVEGASAEAGAAKVRAEAEADALPHANPGTIVG